MTTCTAAAKARGWCALHYRRWRIRGDPERLLRPYRYEGSCSVEDCDKRPYGHGLCYTHYGRWKKTGTAELKDRPKRRPCAIAGCTKLQSARGLCATHYADWRRKNAKERCNASDCERAAYSRGLCGKHYQAFLAHGAATGLAARPPFAPGSRRHRKNWRAFRERLWELCDGLCGICGGPLPVPDECHIDHVVPLSRGGSDDVANLQMAHPECNRRKWCHLAAGTRLPL